MENEKQLMINYFNSKECETVLKKLNINNIKQKKKFLQYPIRKYDNLVDNPDVDHYLEMWKAVVDSVITAPPKTEQLAMAYIERSKLLYYIKRYKDAIKDLDRAFKITKSVFLKILINCYKVINSKACCAGLERNAYKKACYWLNKLDNCKEKDNLTKLVLQAEQCMNLYKKSDIEEEGRRVKLPCMNKGIKINYNKKYGRHLVATRDLIPGEILCVEKFFAVTYISEYSEYFFCVHCLNLTWTVIPCDYCIHSSYCSEKCKRTAWEKYHDIECSVLDNEFLCNISADHSTHLALKLVIMAIKESGSIEKLKNELKSVDNCKDNWAKGIKGTKFCTFKSIYSLTDSCDLNKLDILISQSGIALFSLLMYTEILGRKYTFHNSQDLIKNKDIVFIGALILKFSKIVAINSKVHDKPFGEILINQFLKKFSLHPITGKVILPTCSLINHSCNPNVKKVFMEDGKVCYFTILPIKKNEQIFECYGNSFVFLPKSQRRMYLSDTYNFRCYCEACTNNWSCSLPNENESIDSFEIFLSRLSDEASMKLFIASKIWNYFFLLMEIDGNLKFKMIIMNAIGTDINFLFKSNKYPSNEVFLLILILSWYYEQVYGSRAIFLHGKRQLLQIN